MGEYSQTFFLIISALDASGNDTGILIPRLTSPTVKIEEMYFSSQPDDPGGEFSRSLLLAGRRGSSRSDLSLAGYYIMGETTCSGNV